MYNLISKLKKMKSLKKMKNLKTVVVGIVLSWKATYTNVWKEAK